jgi:hypothetical protein
MGVVAPLCLSEGAIKFSWEIEPGNQGVLLTTCDGQAGKCGYRAWQLAADMRRRYGLPEFKQEETAWDVVATIKKEHDRVINLLKDAAA